MGNDPDAIREEIEQTRSEMHDTVDAIGYKADVPSRAKTAVSDKVESVKARMSEATASMGDATPSRGELKQSARRVAGLARENPIGMAIGAAAIGFLAGLAAPSTRVEERKLGPVADQVKDRVKDTGQEAFERGKEVAGQAVQSAARTAEEQGRQHGQDLARNARQSAEELGDEARQRVTP
jgi:gas vesicle protein